MGARSTGQDAIGADLRQLRYFVAVAEEQSYTRAAERLHVVQQSVSATIKQLEAALGVQLFVRTSRRVEATPAGEALYEHANEVFSALDRAWRAAQDAGGVSKPRLTVGYNSTIGRIVVFHLHEELRTRMLSTELAMRPRYNDELVPQLLNGSLDVGLANYADPVDALEYETVAQLPLGIVVSKRNPLAERTMLSMADLADQTLLVVARDLGPRYYDELQRIAREAGIHSDLVGAPDPEGGFGPPGIHGSVAGLSTLANAQEFASHHRSRSVCLPLDNDAPTIPLELVWHRSRPSPELEQFKEICREAGPIASRAENAAD